MKIKLLILGLVVVFYPIVSYAQYFRMQIDLALPLPLTADQEKKIETIKAALVDLKVDVKPINSTEDTTKMQSHVCNHDSGKPCTNDVDIGSVVVLDINKAIPTPTPAK